MLARLFHIRLLLMLLLVLSIIILRFLRAPALILAIEVVVSARALRVRAVLRVAVVEAILPLASVPTDVDRRLLPLHLIRSLIIIVVVVRFELAELVMHASASALSHGVVAEVVAAASLVARLILTLRVVSSR